MAEKSGFWTTDDTGDGPSAGYSSSDMALFFRSMTQTANLGAVWPDYLDCLEVTGASSPVTVGTGAALVYGYWYVSTSSESVNIPTPNSATRIDRIVVRLDWSAATARIARIAGTEGSGTPPSLTQSSGTTWDIPLAQVEITAGGAIAITDEREYINIVADDGVTTSKLADEAVTTAKIDDEAVTQAKLGADTLRTMAIPLFPVTGGIALPLITFDADKLPAGATVKLCVTASREGGGSSDVTLYASGLSPGDVGSATITGGPTNPRVFKSNDIAANFPNGLHRYSIYHDGNPGSTLHTAWLEIEW